MFGAALDKIDLEHVFLEGSHTSPPSRTATTSYLFLWYLILQAMGRCSPEVSLGVQFSFLVLVCGNTDSNLHSILLRAPLFKCLGFYNKQYVKFLRVFGIIYSCVVARKVAILTRIQTTVFTTVRNRTHAMITTLTWDFSATLNKNVNSLTRQVLWTQISNNNSNSLICSFSMRSFIASSRRLIYSGRWTCKFTNIA